MGIHSSARRPDALAAALTLLFAHSPAAAQIDPGALNGPWREGARDCKAAREPPLEVRAVGSGVYILRESLCATPEAPFMYLLVGKARALLIDTGDVADPAQAPLAGTVLALLQPSGGSTLPLLVVHTHRHLDHRAGDAQFAHRSGVQVVGYDLASVRRFYGFTRWPQGMARIDLGGRTVDALPTPGHSATHVAFYDEATGLLFSGDFLLPGRLFIEDASAYRASARRIAAFVKDRPVSAVLGGHIEVDAHGKLFEWGSHDHPGERALPLGKADILALPAVLGRFNGVYSRSGGFEMINSIVELVVAGVVIVAALAAVIALAAAIVRRRGKMGRLRASTQPV